MKTIVYSILLLSFSIFLLGCLSDDALFPESDPCDIDTLKVTNGRFDANY